MFCPRDRIPACCQCGGSHQLLFLVLEMDYVPGLPRTPRDQLAQFAAVSTSIPEELGDGTPTQLRPQGHRNELDVAFQVRDPTSQWRPSSRCQPDLVAPFRHEPSAEENSLLSPTPHMRVGYIQDPHLNDACRRETSDISSM